MTPSVYAASRPYPGETACGDTWLSLPLKDGLRVAVIDGAGHGPAAEAAATRAKELILACGDEAASQVLRRCHEALHGTRGAVISIIDVRDGELVFSGVGNVEGRLVGPELHQRVLPDRGLLGAALPTVRPMTLTLPPTWAFWIHSDGISSRLLSPWSDFEDGADPATLVEEKLQTWGRVTDDATLVLILPR